jgi:hypothetical protein
MKNYKKNIKKSKNIKLIQNREQVKSSNRINNKMHLISQPDSIMASTNSLLMFKQAAAQANQSHLKNLNLNHNHKSSLNQKMMILISTSVILHSHSKSKHLYSNNKVQTLEEIFLTSLELPIIICLHNLKLKLERMLWTFSMT